MCAVIMLFAADALKHNLFAVSFIIAIVIVKIPDIRALRNNYTVSQHANAKRGSQFRTLVKNFACISAAITVGIFQDYDTVTFCLGWIAVDLRAVVVSLSYPYSTPLVHVNVGRILQHRFCGEWLYFQPFSNG